MNPGLPLTPEQAVAPAPSYKLYGLNSIWGAGFIGGPLMSTYILATNFKQLGDDRRSRLTWILGALFTVVLFAVLLLFPGIEEKIPKYVLPALYCSAGYGLMYSLQRVSIEKHTDAGGKLFSGWRVLGISLVICVVTFVPVFAIGYYSNPFHATESAQFGKQHEIYYFPKEMTAAEVNKLGGMLRQTWLFDESYESDVLARREGNVIEVNVILTEGAWDDPAARSDFSALRDFVQQAFAPEEIVFNLCADFDDVRVSVSSKGYSAKP